MRNKSLFLLIAGVCGTIAAIGVSQWMDAKNGNGAPEMVDILVTVQAINPEEEITADKLRLEQWPADRAPQGASADLALFEGRYAKVPLFADEPMVDYKLMNEVEDKVVPRGFTVVSLPAGRDGTVNLVKPGDRVDIRGFFDKGEMFAQSVSLDVLIGVKVYAIDGITKFDKDTPRHAASNIQLLIRKADIEAFDFAQKLGEIKLSLGSPRPLDESIPEDQASPDALKFMTDLQARRDEQRMLNQAVEEEAPVQVAVVEGKPKKPTFLQTKIQNGRIILYEWEEGNPIPTIIGDTGETDPGLSDDDATNGADGNAAGTPPGNDYLRGENSPFFAPGTGQERE